jgi:hypothetical protein
MPADFSVSSLKAELETDPEGLGYATHIASGADSLVADLLNDRSLMDGYTPRFRLPQPLPMNKYIRWLTKSGVRLKLEAGAQSPDPATKAICKMALDLIVTPHASVFHLEDEDTQNMMAYLVAVGAVTDGERESLLEEALTPVSRAEYLWGVGVQIDHTQVAQALRG